MGKELTEGDLADFLVHFHPMPDVIEGAHKVRAAYISTEPGWVVFKDHEHKAIAHIAEHAVRMIERRQSAAPPRLRCEHLDFTSGPGIGAVTCTICGPLVPEPVA